jgi:hypothetical protein
MKKLFLFSFAIMATAFLNVFAAPIDSYQKLTSAMLEGKQFVFLLDQKQIAGFPGGPTRYFIPTTMELALATHVTQGHVTTSHLQLIDTQDITFINLSDTLSTRIIPLWFSLLLTIRVASNR